ncbi:MAG: hypothetical protein JRG73_02020 [Deltaproteobacteria bacterium]|nr:hypothetical protein [Deltaproteobacteria bacterium]MBW2305685.1 hypothetical protein [Deltaproteobacteria bacterium]
MRKITCIVCLVFALLLGSNALAGPIITGSWDVFSLFNGRDEIIGLELDIEFGGHSLAAHGAVDFADGASIPAYGSGFFTVDDRIVFNLSMDQHLLIVVLDLDGNGTVDLFAPGTNFIDTGTLTFVGILE